MRIRAALARSKNLVTVRVMQAIGPQYAQDYITRFGFDPKLHPPYLTMALGAGSATPMQMVSAYSVFANGGYRDRALPHRPDHRCQGQRDLRSQAGRGGRNAERAIDPRNAWIMTSLLKDVVRAGTATRALSLNRTDLRARPARRTRTSTPGSADTTREMVGVAWIGFDQPKTLGANETGANAALPIWISYMAKALKGTQEANLPMPEGIVAVPINAEPGSATNGDPHRILSRRVSSAPPRRQLDPEQVRQGHPRPALLG